MTTSNSVIVASRIARALGDMTGAFGGMPVRVVADVDDLDVSRTVFDIAGAIGYNCVSIETEDFAVADFDEGSEQRERITSSIMRRSAPALFVVDDAYGVTGERPDEDRLGLLGAIARIAANAWHNNTVAGLVVVTRALNVDVAYDLGKTLGRDDWAGYIKM